MVTGTRVKKIENFDKKMDNFDHYCQQKAAQSGSSFYYSFRFLPPKQQQAIIAVYAFCREVDDIVDNYSDRSVAQKKLLWWAAELERIFPETNPSNPANPSNLLSKDENETIILPEHPVGRALAKARSHFKLQKYLFEEILQGMMMDLNYQGYQTFDDLRLYCHCVASAVGLIAAEIFGYQDIRTLEYARNLGVALQLVNIIRDIGEDASRGRIYIPETELAQFSLTAEDILNKRYSDNFVNLMRFQCERARSYYQKALNALPEVDKYTQRSGLMMAEIYFTVLSEIEKLDFRVFHQRVGLTPIRKLWLAWKTTRKIKPQRLPNNVQSKCVG